MTEKALLCPRCREHPVGRFYGPCDACRDALLDHARRQAVWRRILGWITPGWDAKKDEIEPAVYDEMARREREAKEARWRARRSRR